MNKIYIYILIVTDWIAIDHQRKSQSPNLHMKGDNSSITMMVLKKEKRTKKQKKKNSDQKVIPLTLIPMVEYDVEVVYSVKESTEYK